MESSQWLISQCSHEIATSLTAIIKKVYFTTLAKRLTKQKTEIPEQQVEHMRNSSLVPVYIAPGLSE